ncbi:hypothetical protein CPB84DRAFT_1753081 [Gymnopilus junonius]|uniref:Uncharacterized protein n=1 Tax=Gymnopilus junonius TaxID=109634 RepID=A0A9P5NA74_GYMJU|nr:hypothetical protein CPB84DRAFT_1753081 [Gymnopilus junonius]
MPDPLASPNVSPAAGLPTSTGRTMMPPIRGIKSMVWLNRHARGLTGFYLGLVKPQLLENLCRNDTPCMSRRHLQFTVECIAASSSIAVDEETPSRGLASTEAKKTHSDLLLHAREGHVWLSRYARGSTRCNSGLVYTRHLKERLKAGTGVKLLPQPEKQHPTRNRKPERVKAELGVREVVCRQQQGMVQLNGHEYGCSGHAGPPHPQKIAHTVLEPLHGLEISDSQLQVRAGQQRRVAGMMHLWEVMGRLSAQKNQEKKQQNELTINLLTWPGLPLHGSALHVQPPSSQRTHAHIPQKRGGACSHGPKGEREKRKRGRRKGSGGGERRGRRNSEQKSNIHRAGMTTCVLLVNLESAEMQHGLATTSGIYAGGKAGPSEPILARKSNMITGVTACCPHPSIYGLYYLIDIAAVACSNLWNLSKSVPLRLQNLILKAEDL